MNRSGRSFSIDTINSLCRLEEDKLYSANDISAAVYSEDSVEYERLLARLKKHCRKFTLKPKYNDSGLQVWPGQQWQQLLSTAQVEQARNLYSSLAIITDEAFIQQGDLWINLDGGSYQYMGSDIQEPPPMDDCPEISESTRAEKTDPITRQQARKKKLDKTFKVLSLSAILLLASIAGMWAQKPYLFVIAREHGVEAAMDYLQRRPLTQFTEKIGEAWLHYWARDLDTARQHAWELLSGMSLSDQQLSDAYRLIAHIEMEAEDYQSAQNYLDLSYKHTEDLQRQAMIKLANVYLHIYEGKLDQAGRILQTLETSQTILSFSEQMTMTAVKAFLYRTQGRFDEAISTLEKAHNVYQDNNENLFMTSFRLELSYIHTIKGDCLNGQEWAKKAKPLLDDSKDQFYVKYQVNEMLIRICQGIEPGKEEMDFLYKIFEDQNFKKFRMDFEEGQAILERITSQ